MSKENFLEHTIPRMSKIAMLLYAVFGVAALISMLFIETRILIVSVIGIAISLTVLFINMLIYTKCKKD